MNSRHTSYEAACQQKLALVSLLVPLCPHLAVNLNFPGVRVPPHLTGSVCTFRIGQDPNVLGMPDLTLDDHGWRGTLSFGGALFYCVVPWGAVLSCWVQEPFSGPIVQWPEMRAAVEEHNRAEAEGAEKPAPVSGLHKPVKSGHLRVIK